MFLNKIDIRISERLKKWMIIKLRVRAYMKICVLIVCISQVEPITLLVIGLFTSLLRHFGGFPYLYNLSNKVFHT